MLSRNRLAATVSTIGLGLGILATAALAADGEERAGANAGGANVGVEPTEIALLEREQKDLTRAIDEHRTDELSGRYRDLYVEAEKLDAEPERNLVAASGEPRLDRLDDEVGELRDDVAAAKKEQAEPAAGDFALTGGVSQATLDAIASCESGGDPTAVNAAGYYGKYQFDTGTWASVGGSGNPAEASEAEQDMRASMLYAQAGSSPWPVCGQ
ncbi:MAG: transglycosylase family protein [Solirubrobacterales bacterium]